MKTSSLVFACYEKACAPPPAGKGGSLPSRIKKWRSDRAEAERIVMEHQLRVKATRGGVGPGGGQITIGGHKWDLGKPKLNQDGTTNVANPGGVGGGSVGRRRNITEEAAAEKRAKKQRDLLKKAIDRAAAPEYRPYSGTNSQESGGNSYQRRKKK